MPDTTKLAFARRRLSRSAAYRAGDAQLFETSCGRYRLLRVKRAWGVELPEHWHPIAVTGGAQVHLAPERNVRSRARAEKICRDHLRAAESTIPRAVRRTKP